MNLKQHVPIFVSSTFTDLVPHRKALMSGLEKLKVAVVGMEVFGARSAEPLETCIREVANSSVFIAIIAMRFGSVDPKTGRSFVQREYETALEHQLEVLVYLIDEDNAAIAPKFVDTGESSRQLAEFKQLLRNKHTVDLFTTPEDLATKVERDLLKSVQGKAAYCSG
jgi:hypothetical protein